MKPTLIIDNLCHSYHTLEGETSALEHLSFCAMQGEFLSIVGPSGCGKSTLLSMIAGLLMPESGQILLNGVPLTSDTTHIGYMLQHDHLLEWRSVYRNAILGLEIQHRLNSETKNKARDLLSQYQLSEFAKSRPSQLSGGMRQRVALIRTLVLEPDLLLLDEPFSALDYQTRLTVSNDIGQIIRKEKRTAILVTHDLSEAISLGDKVIVLSQRPARVKKEIPLHFTLSEDTPINRRSTPEFKSYFNEVWRELNEDI